MRTYYRRCIHMRRMFGIYINIRHRRHHSCEYKIPLFGRILVNTYLHGLKNRYLLRKRHQRITKPHRHIMALLRSPIQFKCYNMLYHNIIIVRDTF